MIDLLWQIPAALVGLPLGFAGTRWMLLWGLHDEKVDSTPQVEAYEKPVELVQKFHSASETSEAFLHRDINGMKWTVERQKEQRHSQLLDELKKIVDLSHRLSQPLTNEDFVELMGFIRMGDYDYVEDLFKFIREEYALLEKPQIQKNLIADRQPQVKLYPLNYVSKSTDSISYERSPLYRPEGL